MSRNLHYPDELRLAAQKKAVIEMLAEHLQDTYMEQESNEVKECVCETLPYHDRVVPQEVLVEVYEDLTAIAQQQAQIIRSYRVVKRSPRENVTVTAQAEPADADGVRPAAKGIPRPKKPAGSEGAGHLG